MKFEFSLKNQGLRRIVFALTLDRKKMIERIVIGGDVSLFIFAIYICLWNGTCDAFCVCHILATDFKKDSFIGCVCQQRSGVVLGAFIWLVVLG